MRYSKPDNFHKKLFWLSAKWRNPLIVKCADKYAVRDYIIECGCGDILNELLGVYEKIDDINWEDLPNRFVMKSNNGSGNNFFCTDKSKCDSKSFFHAAKIWNKQIYGVDTAEYQYYPIPFKIICEKYLLESDNDSFIEYQLFCINGYPDSFLVRNDLETSGKNPFAVSYSLDWKRLFLRVEEERYTFDIPEPVNRKKMITYATRLAKPFPYVRIDFYEVNGELYFGEMTFTTHGNVLSNYTPETLNHWDKVLSLPSPYNKKDRY